MMIHFIRPYWLLLLIPAVLYLAWLIYSSLEHNPWKKVCDPHLLPALLQSSPAKKQGFHLSLFLFFTLAIVAIAGPSWKKVATPIFRDVSSLMLVLDLSPAMEATDLKPDRLSRAKFKIRDLINAAPNTEMGLVVFSGESFVVSPLSQDASTLNAMLDELSPQIMPITGAEIGAGLQEGLTLLKQSATQHSNVLLITASEPTSTSWNIAKAIAQSGNQLNVLAMVERNETTDDLIKKLDQLAKTGGGSLTLFTLDASDIKNILSKTNDRQIIEDATIKNTYVWLDAGPWICLMLVPLALIVLRERLRYENPH